MQMQIRYVYLQYDNVSWNEKCSLRLWLLFFAEVQTDIHDKIDLEWKLLE